MTDEEFEETVRKDSPYFRRLNPILKSLGFTVAAHLTEHEKHWLAGVAIPFDCQDCVRIFGAQSDDPSVPV
jgi:hypothetical protein